jgi:hypothetical protein
LGPKGRELNRCELKSEFLGKAPPVALESLVEAPRGDAVKSREVGIEHHALSADLDNPWLAPARIFAHHGSTLHNDGG